MDGLSVNTEAPDGRTTEHNDAYGRGVDLISPHLRSDGRAAPASAERDLRQGIGYLNRALELAPDNWPALWGRGKAYQALLEHEAAYTSFRKAYDIHAQNPDVGRELSIECMELGRCAEALEVAQAAWQMQRDDAGLLGNLAVARLLNGQLDEALQNVEDALGLDPGDSINLTVKAIVQDVRTGRRPQPTRASDLR